MSYIYIETHAYACCVETDRIPFKVPVQIATDKEYNLYRHGDDATAVVVIVVVVVVVAAAALVLVAT